MSAPYTAPSFKLGAFNCAFCGAFSNQKWYLAGMHEVHISKGKEKVIDYKSGFADKLQLARCSHCEGISMWVEERYVFPYSGTAPLSNPDMPDDVKLDFEEARTIITASPRGAVALLRLAVQKLLKHLGGTGKHIDSDIALLVKNGLPERVQQALDSVRVVGNNAVHPGQIDLNDNPEMAAALFGLINFIVNVQITQPKEATQFYSTLPQGARDAVTNRDKLKTKQPSKI